MSEPLAVVALLTPEEYLDAERSVEVRHEYLRGQIYAMSGAKSAHNLVVGNLHALLWNRLVGHPCRVYASDMKLRAAEDVFYYPDLMVCCEPVPGDADYAQHPRIVIEVASPSTRRIDEGEKALAYWNVPSIETYVLVAQDVLWVRALHRGATGWETQSLTRPDDVLRIDALSFATPLSAIYTRTEAGQADP
ncbi:MAG: Uma2 family endonuclease [Armatimonadetes bacterium]|nr:Uma2 family endonuclease [Armatimonadota bacterium]